MIEASITTFLTWFGMYFYFRNAVVCILSFAFLAFMSSWFFDVDIIIDDFLGFLLGTLLGMFLIRTLKLPTAIGNLNLAAGFYGPVLLSIYFLLRYCHPCEILEETQFRVGYVRVCASYCAIAFGVYFFRRTTENEPPMVKLWGNVRAYDKAHLFLFSTTISFIILPIIFYHTHIWILQSTLSLVVICIYIAALIMAT